jgi:hypothetical protein
MPGEMLLTEGAILTCSKGTQPSHLGILPDIENLLAGRPTFAKHTDTTPNVNLRPFGLCTSMANPAVGVSYAASVGALSPVPCTPVPITPWLPAPSTTMGCSVLCAFAGVIKCIAPAAAMVEAQVAAAMTAAGLVHRSPAPELASPQGRR